LRVAGFNGAVAGIQCARKFHERVTNRLMGHETVRRSPEGLSVFFVLPRGSRASKSLRYAIALYNDMVRHYRREPAYSVGTFIRVNTKPAISNCHSTKRTECVIKSQGVCIQMTIQCERGGGRRGSN
jgi:hypothetical protein